MDKLESAKILAVLKAAYPQAYKDVDAQSMVALWQSMFLEDDYNIVAAAVKAFILNDTKGFPPAIGMVKDYILKLTEPQEMTELEAWGIVKKAISNSGYNAVEEYEKMPGVLRQIIGSPNILKEWAMVDLSELETVIQSNFMRSYKVKAKRVKELAMLPPEVKEVSQMIADKLNMKRIEG